MKRTLMWAIEHEPTQALDREGFIAAHKYKRFFEDKHFTEIYCSSKKSELQTAEIIGSTKIKPINSDSWSVLIERGLTEEPSIVIFDPESLDTLYRCFMGGDEIGQVVEVYFEDNEIKCSSYSL